MLSYTPETSLSQFWDHFHMSSRGGTYFKVVIWPTLLMDVPLVKITISNIFQPSNFNCQSSNCLVLIGAVSNGQSRYVDYVDGSIMYDGTFLDVSKTKINILPLSNTHETCIGLDNQGNARVCGGAQSIGVCEIGLEETGCYSNDHIHSYISPSTYEHGDQMVKNFCYTTFF